MLKQLEFIAKIAKMGDEKRIIIIPKNYHKFIKKEGLDEEVRIRIEKI